MNVLVIDVGGSHIKIMATGQKEERRMDSGPTLTAAQMTAGVRALAEGWKYEAVSIGYPGPVVRNKPVADPHNLGKGWVGFDYERALGAPVKMLNDAAMQALGGYRGGRMLFLGFGTGLGSALIFDGVIVPMELAHLPYRKATFEDYVGVKALENDGKQKWRKRVTDVIVRLTAALEPEDIVLGGGNAANITELPPRCRLGLNRNAFPGGFRMWADPSAKPAAEAKSKPKSKSKPKPKAMAKKSTKPAKRRAKKR